MLQWRLLRLSLITMCFLCPLTSAHLDRQELVALAKIVRTMGATLNSSVDPCESKTLVISDSKPGLDQNKVVCNCHPNPSTCHITILVLRMYSLPGTLPPQLVDLPYLEELDLTRNYLEGTLPKEWATMKFLRSISLAANRITGEIPREWGSFTNLTSLSLEANRLSGNIPAELGNLVNLTVLILSSNKFVGNLPEKLAAMKNLTDFRISGNNFSGSIPQFIGNWTRLKRLELYATGLEGPIPNGIFHLEALNDLRITDMNGANFFPEYLPHKDYMKNLVLRNVNMSGSIPPIIWEMKKLSVLDVSLNRLKGNFPSIPHVPEFTFLGGNMLSGTVPDSILDEDKYIDLSYNNVTWPCQKNTVNINFYGCSSQTASSGIHQCPSKPNCKNKYHSFHINCGGENVTITDNSGKFSYDGDDYVGSASTNYVSGSNWGYSSTGVYMDNDKKAPMFTISNSSKLSMDCSELYMTARRAPTSLIYYGFCLENGEYTVRLHFAEIEITDNEAYRSLGQRIFDIYIQGKLEWKDFNIMEEANGTGKPVTKQINVAVTDNMLEIRLYWAGKGTTSIPKKGTYGPLISAISACHSSVPCAESPLLVSTKASKKRKFSVIVGAVTSLLCLILFVLGVLCWRHYLGDKNTRERELRGLDLQIGSFTLRQIKAATNNFDSANKIGEGGFGSVFKGQLSDGTLIAVKQLSSKSRQGYREFVNEIGLISALQHPNLVKLYGCCTEGNQLLLVYEYMENNSLAYALFDKNDAKTSALKLDWATRQKICVGIARGIAFLQEESTLKIVHRDIKATNVLLDEDLNAKISDFGLARLNGEESTHISTRVAGTIGYMAPEYALWGYLTNKADIYSFGVVALEIVSGKNNTSYKPENECVCLLDLAFVLQQRGSLMEIVDPKLGSEFNQDEAERMIKVALLCTNASPTLRPTMSAVVSMLEGQTVVQDVISDPGIYNDDLRFRPLRDQQQQMQNQSLSRSQPPNLPSDGI
ncbi:probable LRR receptor-like serine/threonine-protein kinase At1g29720 isoform X1 [Vitis vinifera]|nr:probable LRR receptor-like serine/threonine-protein kinase At1g29720 isoform X1 [Vitis vinifera]|eukprot:XP_010655583.1 PREDICTED: probable LRR receptor-like serine/threonine-protein kinase At1g29720 isoform X1 [Vitis vinifera]